MQFFSKNDIIIVEMNFFNKLISFNSGGTPKSSHLRVYLIYVKGTYLVPFCYERMFEENQGRSQTIPLRKHPKYDPPNIRIKFFLV